MLYYFDSSQMIRPKSEQPAISLSVDSLVASSQPAESTYVAAVASEDHVEPRYRLTISAPDPEVNNAFTIGPSDNIQCAPTIDSINRKKYNNWFTRIVDQRGEDFLLHRLTCDEVGKNAERIFDDMIDGRIDYVRQGKYIVLPTVIKTLIDYCTNKIAINRALQYSLNYTYNDYTNRMQYINDLDRMNILSRVDNSLSRNIIQATVIVNQNLVRYESIYQKLKYIDQTGNVSILLNLPNELGNNRKFSKKRY